MSETKRCKARCGAECPSTEEHDDVTWFKGAGHHWCSPECRDNRRRMHEGEAAKLEAGQRWDRSDGKGTYTIKRVCPSPCPTMRPYGPQEHAHFVDERGEEDNSPVAWIRAHCTLAAPAPAVEGEPPEMTLAEALLARADGKQVEASLPVPGGWSIWSDFMQTNGDVVCNWQAVKSWARGRFRLKPQPAPALTRVQQMAQTTKDGTATVDVISEAIRAVCEWLYSRPGTGKVKTDTTVAMDIEREFLGPGEGKR